MPSIERKGVYHVGERRLDGYAQKEMTVLSNKYYINCLKPEETLHFRKKAVTARRIQLYTPNGHRCIRQTDTRVSAKRTQVYPPNGHTCIRQTVTGVSARRSQTENNNNININPNRKESGSSWIRRDPGSGEPKMLDQHIDAMSVDELTKPERRGTDPASKSGDCPRFYAWQTAHKSRSSVESVGL